MSRSTISDAPHSHKPVLTSPEAAAVRASAGPVRAFQNTKRDGERVTQATACLCGDMIEYVETATQQTCIRPPFSTSPVPPTPPAPPAESASAGSPPQPASFAPPHLPPVPPFSLHTP